MIELGFKEGQIHPNRDAEFPNYSIDSLVMEGVLSHFFDPIDILNRWLPKIKVGGHGQIIDTDFDSLIIEAYAGLQPDKLREIFYGTWITPRNSLIRYEEVIDIAKRLNLNINSISIEGIRFQVEVSR